MLPSTIIVLGIAVLAAGFFLGKSSHQARYSDGPDGLVLDQLRKAGSDVSKEHDVEFFLYFPSQNEAECAQQELLSKGFSAEVSHAAKDSDWLCLATGKMLPTHSHLIAARNELNALAKKYNGEYDGWGTPVVE